MNSVSFSVFFIGFLLISVCLQFWLSARHIRHILSKRDSVPAQFAEKISLAAHQKAADYTVTKTKLGLLMLMLNVPVLLGFTLFGGLQWLSVTIAGITGPGMLYQLSLFAAFALITGVLDLPFTYYYQFVVEEKFGFNKMTRSLFVRDLFMNSLLSIAIGAPLLWLVLTLMASAGSLWWLYTWIALMAFLFLRIQLYPTFIAPLFNRFTPLEDDSLRSRIEGLMARVGFASKGLFVMDGSKRSAHGNAYFSGFGAAKRIVFFDTLIEKLSPAEIEAVLAHELGHFKLRHIVKRISVMFVFSLGFLALLGYLKQQVWFYTGLGVDPLLLAQNDAMALLLFMLVLPVFTFLLSPLAAISSRKHEFEADAFAAKHASAQDLIAALVKMYDDNASTLTPDPLHSAFYDSHPPAAIRIQHLLAAQ